MPRRCPHCGAISEPYKTTRKTKSRNRIQLYTCPEKACRKQYTATVGTPLEGSHVPLEKWLEAARILHGNPGRGSAMRIHKTLGVSYPTARRMKKVLLPMTQQHNRNRKVTDHD